MPAYNYITANVQESEIDGRACYKVVIAPIRSDFGHFIRFMNRQEAENFADFAEDLPDTLGKTNAFDFAEAAYDLWAEKKAGA